VAKEGRVQRHDSLVLKYVDEADGKPVPDVAVKVTINQQPPVVLHDDAAGVVRIPLPKEEVAYLAASGTTPGYVRKFLQWRKYGDPLQIPETYQVKMEKGSCREDFKLGQKRAVKVGQWAEPGNGGGEWAWNA
jgi:hypothetical protein